MIPENKTQGFFMLKILVRKKEKMSIDQQTYQNFRMVPINESNSHLLKKMVRFQAQHHKCKCVWDTGDKSSFGRLQSIVENNANGTGGFFIFTPESREPAAYVVHMPIVSTQGQGLYMEDICVHPQCRHGGLGLYAISELAKLAQENDKDYVSWVVAGNNESGLKFYNRLNSQQESTVPFFISSSVLRQYGDLGNTRELSFGDKILLNKFCYQNGFDNKFVSFEEGHRLIASFDERGNINAVSLGSVNTSTFRATQGIEVSEVLYSREFQQDLDRKRSIQANLINRNIEVSQNDNLMGHMIWGVEKEDTILQSDVERNFGGEVLTMTDDRESTLDRHYLDSVQLSNIARRHVERCESRIGMEKEQILPSYRLRLQAR